MARKRVVQRAAVGVLGKHITRRSHGKCELCGSREGPALYELPPFPPDPDPDRTLMACASCRGWLEHGKVEPIRAHFLRNAAWSDEPAARLAACRLLVLVEAPDDPWLRDTLEAVGFDPAKEELTAPDEWA